MRYHKKTFLSYFSISTPGVLSQKPRLPMLFVLQLFSIHATLFCTAALVLSCTNIIIKVGFLSFIARTFKPSTVKRYTIDLHIFLQYSYNRTKWLSNYITHYCRKENGIRFCFTRTKNEFLERRAHREREKQELTSIGPGRQT